MRSAVLISCLALAACSTVGGPYPSLQPRAAEGIDPRVPVDRAINDRPVTPALVQELRQLVSQARAGDATFQRAMASAERLAASAGPKQSEGWIAAQEALSAAVAAAGPTRAALGDIDAIGAHALQTQGGIAPNDLGAIRRASEEVGALDSRQSARIKAVQQRLGL